jgi:hypothetical protein
MPYGGPHSQEVHARFNITNDPLGNFVKQYCVLDRNRSTPKDTLLTAFTAFAEDHDIHVAIVSSFFKRLYNRYPSVMRHRVRTGPERTQIVNGIGLSDAGLTLVQSTVESA